MRRPILISLILVVVAVGLVVAVASRQTTRDQPISLTTQPLAAFTLHRTDGSVFSERDLQGRIHLVYFGFTTCPDICPTELGWMVRVLRRLGPLAANVQPVFVTIDPERDTPAKLAAYTAVFDPRFIPLHGSLAEITTAADAFGVIFRKQTPVSQQPGFYLIDHTMTTFVVGRDGSIVHRLASHELDPEAAAALIRPLAAATP